MTKINKENISSDKVNDYRKLGLETVGLLTEGIVHDFNNLISTISGYAELLENEVPKDSSLYEKVSRIRKSALKAALLSDRILRLGSSHPVEIEKVSVTSIINEAIDIVRSITPDNVRIKSHLKNDGLCVLADPLQLFRAILNIMINAIQAMKDKGGVLSVRSSLVQVTNLKPVKKTNVKNGKYVCVIIKDSGPGIDKEVKRNLFKPIYGSSGNVRGIGLFTVKEIINDLDGIIKISTRKNLGTACSIYLPFCTK